MVFFMVIFFMFMGLFMVIFFFMYRASYFYGNVYNKA